jgi:hypothetical protein
VAKRPARGLATLILVVVTLVGMSTAAVVLARHQDQSDRDHPAAAPPADLCAVLDPATVERMVPWPARTDEETYSSRTAANGDAGCGFRTVGAPPAQDRYGSLTVRVLRHGQVAGLSGTRRAEKAYDELCASLENGVPGQPGAIDGKLGDQACLMLDSGSSGGTVFGYLRVRRAADLLYVDYYIHPGAQRQVETAVADISRAVLGAL